MRSAILFTVMKFGNKISVSTIWWPRKCGKRSEFNHMKTKTYITSLV